MTTEDAPAATPAAGSEPKEEPKTFSTEELFVVVVVVLPFCSVQMFPDGVNSVFLKPKEEADRLEEVYGKGQGIFENPEGRDIAMNAEKIKALLAANGLKEGATIVDLGAGTGLFLSSFAHMVGSEGKLYASEISEAFAELLRRKAAQDELVKSVTEIIVSPEDSLSIADGVADVVFICDVYHHLTYPVTVMRHVRRILKPEGKLVMIDFHRDDEKIWRKPKGWAYQHLRADQDTFRSEILSAGFTLVEEPEIDTLTENYIMIFSPNPPDAETSAPEAKSA
ncbi:Methyltransferase-like protein 7B [Hondaea fermentalgiana]|uniref:Methyltransferase-like protein 7B n=1 Tax=Hondaea fermentalgiana TaxID=2315210 RepID=A0A2R5G486_9STRA|nr:Methyltransferase-like protein 7B [Hondaea fermentalgiana]|eukprot:GBG25836.1 Methyltransferase-like protein 7B [Hondaea fermentalgiana]